MSLSTLRKFVLPPVIAAAAVFSAMSCPLAVLGDKPINIRFEDEPVFDGKLRDVAPPYVVVVTVVSLGAGIAAAAMCGWQSSSRKSVKFEQQLFTLEKNLEEKDNLLKELKLSESRLQVSGLNNFLDDEVPFDQVANQKPAVVTQPVVAQAPAPTYQPSLKEAPSSVAPRPNTSKSTSVTTAAYSFASAQNSASYGQADVSRNNIAASTQSVKATVTPQEFEELQRQLREMMERMQTMQNSMQQTSHINTHVKDSNKFQVYYEAATSDEVRFH